MTARRYLGVIPARGTSRRISGKNMRLLGGKPLLAHTVEAARDARSLCDVVVSTDSPEIAQYALSLGIDTQGLRPAELARDDSPVIGALQYAVAKYEIDHEPIDAAVLLQPTSPFRLASHIDAAVALHESTGADTITSVRRAKEHPYWMWRRSDDGIVPYYSLREVACARDELPEALIENGAIFVIRRSLIVRGVLYGDKIAPFVMDEHASIDVDTHEDLAWAEYVLLRRQAERK